MSNELKPCPFCQSRAEHYSFNYRKHTVRCRYCLADCGEHDTPERAAFVWNTRPAEDAKDREIENLKAALNEVLNIQSENYGSGTSTHLKLLLWASKYRTRNKEWGIETGKDTNTPANAPDTGKMEEK